MATSVRDTMAIISEYLGEVGMSKEAAAPTAPDAEQPGAASAMDRTSIKGLQSESNKMRGNQSAAGKEQTAEAKASGSNVDEVATNSDEDKDAPHAKDAPKTLDSDETLQGNSDVLGTVKKQEINMAQKMARAEKLANSILGVIEESMNAQYEAQKQAAEQPALTEEEQEFQKLAEQAAIHAQDCFESHLLGALTRRRDELALSNSKLDPRVLQKVGGVAGLLDKVAAEDIGAVLPEGFELPPEAMDAAAGGGEAMGEEMPEEAMGEGGEEGGVGEGELEEIAAALDEAGVTPEDLESALTDIQALQEAGVSPEELAQAIEELGAEEAGGGEEMPAEEVEEAPEEEEKIASEMYQNRVNLIKDFLRQ